MQSDLESLEARLKFLSQSSAFSFISVSLESVPVELAIDGGADIAAAMGHPVTYRPCEVHSTDEHGRVHCYVEFCGWIP